MKLLLLVLFASVSSMNGFQMASPITRSVLLSRRSTSNPSSSSHTRLLMSERDDNNNDNSMPLTSPNALDAQPDDDEMTEAATNTINERLLAELQQASDKEKYGKRSSLSKKMGISPFGTMLTDEERQVAIDEARNLNGVNPTVAITGGIVGLTMAAGLWVGTTYLGEFFSAHPVDTEVYFLVRINGVFRNVVMGLSSLASGFFGVTGVGILALGIRVGYGVMTGELDPTPLKKQQKSDEPELPNVWDLMMNKKPTRRVDSSKKDNDLFG